MYLLRDKNGKIIATVCNKFVTLQQYTIDTNICLVHNIFVVRYRLRNKNEIHK